MTLVPTFHRIQTDTRSKKDFDQASIIIKTHLIAEVANTWPSEPIVNTTMEAITTIKSEIKTKLQNSGLWYNNLSLPQMKSSWRVAQGNDFSETKSLETITTFIKGCNEWFSFGKDSLSLSISLSLSVRA